jgi:hypothetical protein
MPEAIGPVDHGETMPCKPARFVRERAKKKPPLRDGFVKSNREASNRVDRSHSTSSELDVTTIARKP